MKAMGIFIFLLGLVVLLEGGEQWHEDVTRYVSIYVCMYILSESDHRC
jgi:uncharacterized membrane protein